MPWLLIIGLVFILIILGLRYFAYRSTTNKVCSLDPDNDYCRKHYKKNLDKNTDSFKKCDVIIGETPNGGVKTVICYVDDKNNRTSKKKASKVVVRELDEKNHPVYETWTTLKD